MYCLVNFDALFTRVMKINLTRDSVAMGDDMDAPHDRILEIETFTMEGVCQRIWEVDYLPLVQGLAIWVLVGFGPVAIITQNPGFAPNLEVVGFEEDKLRFELKRTNNRLHFIYYSQVSLESSHFMYCLAC